ncbi:MAG: hypothetical protein KAU62_05290 [Candidatus Heimdallarchaeota archaeon]|nr:hypothetical protein [Candidatus Heimdallarchaeota archaeon]MCG3255480.1 hypothetical protein [Candidatus Heimdallarchaeota archaeon]MCK4610554.1 hypothetical protein [Candidatus Heimdallarchaeota archaeon]
MVKRKRERDYFLFQITGTNGIAHIFLKRFKGKDFTSILLYITRYKMDKIEFFRRLNRKISRIHVILSDDMEDERLKENPLIVHIQNHPKLKWRDIYKFLMQGTCGWVHLKHLGSENRIMEYLFQEFASSGEPLDNEDLYELLDLQTKYVRLNLRVWKKIIGDDPAAIWSLMLKVSKEIPTNTELFLQRWLELIELYERGIIKIKYGRKRKYGRLFQWLNFVLELISKAEKISEIPLVRHSAVFRRNYKPNYRIVKEEDVLKHIA